MKQAYIIDGVRTPIGNYKGTLSSVRTDDLGAHVIKALVSNNPQIPSEAFDDVIMGCANQAGEDNRNVARMSLLLAGLPFSVPGETVNRLCSSGLSAILTFTARTVTATENSLGKGTGADLFQLDSLHSFRWWSGRGSLSLGPSETSGVGLLN